MKSGTKILFGFLAVLTLALAIVLVPTSGDYPGYSELKNSCDIALSANPNSEALDSWMTEYKISPMRRNDPIDNEFKSYLISYGISQSAVNSPATCTSFEKRAQGGLFARHVCYGYFVFDLQGKLIDYTIYDISYGM